MSTNRSGFTMVEMLVSIVILAIGLMALAAGSGSVTRTLHGSRVATQAAQQAAERMDLLRASSRATLPPCTSANFVGGNRNWQGVTMTWVIVGTGQLRRVNVVTTYPLGRNKTRTDTLASTVYCN